MLVLLMLAGCGAGVSAGDPAGPPARPRVLTRLLHLTRGPDRPLDTTVWYPGAVGGRHPIVLFSHGLGGLPAQFAPLAAGWVEAGFVVAAPAYPHTNGRTRVDRDDIANQPADAAYVLARVKALGTTPGDVLFGHLDTGRVAAVGFSAGGTTTLGLLRARHDPSLRVAVSVAGRRPASAFGGPPVPVLCIHGDRDRVVPIAAGRQACEAVPWDKRFVAVPGAGHGQYLHPRNRAYPRVSTLILDFLRTEIPARSA
jgi:dienelactone hydrolase